MTCGGKQSRTPLAAASSDPFHPSRPSHPSHPCRPSQPSRPSSHSLRVLAGSQTLSQSGQRAILQLICTEIKYPIILYHLWRGC